MNVKNIIIVQLKNGYIIILINRTQIALYFYCRDAQKNKIKFIIVEHLDS